MRMSMQKRAWYRSPMAVLLIIFLLGHIAPVPQLRLIPSATAQTTLCLPSSPPVGQGAILQACSADTDLETLAVQHWLNAHDIPESEKPFLYQYGREGLRSEMRAYLLTYLLAIIKKAPADRTVAETNIYNWFQNVVWEKQKAQYQAAINDRNNWLNDKCHWRPDAAIAQVYGVTYDSATYCGNTGLLTLFSIAPAMPSKDYFLGAALKKTYGQNVASTAGGTVALRNMNRDMDSALGIAAAAGAGIAGFYGVTVGVWLATTGAWYFAANAIVEGINIATTSSGVGIVLAAVLIGAIATFDIVMNQKNLDELQSLDSDYQYILSHPPDLEGYAHNPTGVYKLHLAFIENTLPDFPSSAVLPTGHGGDRAFVITPQFGGAPQTNGSFTYRDWDGTRWTAQTYGQWLTHNGATTGGGAVSEFSPSFRFLDWNGKKYTASRKSFNFIVSKSNPANTDHVCEADASGVTALTDVSNCSVYTTNLVKLKDTNGNNVAVTIAGTPAFTSRTTGSMLVGSPSSFDIMATGNPLPSITLGPPLYPGFSFQDLGSGQARIAYDGNPLLPGGDYIFLLYATNAQGTAQQFIRLTVSSPVKILDATDVTFMAGAPFTYTVSVSGSPRPAITCPGSLFGQVAFTDNGNGSITFTGTLTGPPPDGGLYLAPSCYLTANNGITTDTATMIFRSSPAPIANLTSATTGTFANLTTGGTPSGSNALPLATSGAATPVSFTFPCGDKPFWLIVNNKGDGTGTLTGNPPYSFTSASFTLQAYAAGSLPPAAQCSTPNFTIRGQLLPVFTDPLYATLQIGFPYSFHAFGTEPGAVTSLNGQLPSNVQFSDGGFGSWSLTGAPPAGSGGEYDPDITMTIGSASATRKLRVIVLESPAIMSANTAIFPTGLNTSFRVVTTGFPRAQLQGIPGLNSNAMRFTMTGNLPAGVTFRDTDTSGSATPIGAGILSGTPQAGTTGTYAITITADNGVSPAATQIFTLLVTLAGDVNNDGRIDCTDVSLVKTAFGAYRGTAKYDPRSDINSDGVVDVRDLSLVSSKLPSGTKCP